MIGETILKYWIQWACGLMALSITALAAWVRREFKKRRQRDDALTEGVKAILHDRLWQAHKFYMAQGFCPLEDKKNIEYLFKPYAGLGGNGTGENAYNDMQELPTTRG